MSLFQEALKIAKMIEDDDSKSNALQAIIEKTEDSSIFQQVRKIAKTIEDNKAKSEVFASIASKHSNLREASLPIREEVKAEDLAGALDLLADR